MWWDASIVLSTESGASLRGSVGDADSLVIRGFRGLSSFSSLSSSLSRGFWVDTSSSLRGSVRPLDLLVFGGDSSSLSGGATFLIGLCLDSLASLG